MLDYQIVMLTRVMSHERIHGVTTPEGQTMKFFSKGLRGGWRKLATFLAKPVNKVIGQRYQNRHRSLEGTT